jgi:hypothetical protein
MSKHLHRKIEALDWSAVAGDIASQGYARTKPLLTAGQCGTLAALYDDDGLFRNTVEMARYRFGEGEYRYFADPLPETVAALRQGLYRHLAPVANAMMADLRREPCYPETLAGYLADCRAAGQDKPTPLLLNYQKGGYNRLHRDLYGDLRFPLQAVCLLSPVSDFEGGEFLLVEQQPRAQSIGRAIALKQGEFVIFPVAERPVAGKRGFFAAQMRHGVSPLARGQRTTLGIIFHNAA